MSTIEEEGARCDNGVDGSTRLTRRKREQINRDDASAADKLSGIVKEESAAAA